MAILLLCTACPIWPRSDWILIWHDEFNGSANSPPDTSKWSYDLGAGGWGNHELESYTNHLENVHQDGRGHLVITAIREQPDNYTSGRIKTLGKFEFEYGRVEARIKLPAGRGLWPAFWMLGGNIQDTGWPGCGEIDIMEQIGREPRRVHGTVHGPGYSGGKGISASFTSKSGFSRRFHVFRVDWDPNSLQFYVDNHPYAKLVPTNLPRDSAWVFDHPFGILLNLAVGGDWPGPPDSSTMLPQKMLIDWIRVSRRRRHLHSVSH